MNELELLNMARPRAALIASLYPTRSWEKSVRRRALTNAVRSINNKESSPCMLLFVFHVESAGTGNAACEVTCRLPSLFKPKPIEDVKAYGTDASESRPKVLSS